jgi:hypothetical protein
VKTYDLAWDYSFYESHPPQGLSEAQRVVGFTLFLFLPSGKSAFIRSDSLRSNERSLYSHKI